MSLQIVPLTKKHLRTDFDCGKKPLNTYLQKQASQDFRNKVAACFVLVDEQNIVKGYYTLCSGTIPREVVPEMMRKKLPKYTDLPVTLLGRLAIDVSLRRQRYGETLLMHAFYNSCKIASPVVASMAIVVDPIDEEAKSYYLKHDFIELRSSGRLFISMKTVAKSFGL